MDQVQEENGQVGARIAAEAYRALNDTIQYMHAGRLTRHQIVMFTLADMMTVCEVAGALVAKAARMAREGHAEAEHFAVMARVFARKAARMVQDGAGRCAAGFVGDPDEADPSKGQALVDSVNARFPNALVQGLWDDMNLVGDQLQDLV
jgi:alkylation response protein AidB-like acyl-CoA dehydrogenase